MNKNGSARNSKKDVLLWGVVAILIAAGIAANYYYQQVAGSLRLAVGILVVCILLAIAAQTKQGKWSLAFAKEARGELRKVVWPTRQETMQTTLLVVALVVVMALLLWGIDSLLVWAVSWLAGQRG